MQGRKKIVKHKKYAEIIIANKSKNETVKAIVDIGDVDKVKDINWCISHGYAVSWKHRMHRLIMNPPKGMVVDHINNNRLDNRKENLRICTRWQNCRNTKDTKGITWNRFNKKWIAQVMFNRKQIYLGSFENKEDALKARIDGEKKYFGEFAPKR